MSRFVLDCSVTMGWCFLDEVSPYAASVLQAMSSMEALVPAIWPLEVSNAILVGERRGRLTEAESAKFVSLVRSLPIEVTSTTMRHVLSEVLSVARRNSLTSYDASYLELAMREGLPLATLDDKLRAAAQKLGIKEMIIPSLMSNNHED